jgi:O-antigen/teichoic acid export membrane protein
MGNKLKKGLIAIFFANVINLSFNLLTNFLLPKYLSVDSYAAIKTFQLYTTYIGIFALGCADGMYLRYGGKDFTAVNGQILRNGVFSFRIMMVVESIIIIPLSIILRDKIFIAFSLTILSVNMTGYYKNLYQAVGEFKKYSLILNWTTISTFVINIVLLFGIKSDDYFLYLIGYAIVDMLIWLMLEYNIYRILRKNRYKGKSVFSIRLLLNDIQSGFLLMVGNFSNILLSSMDRWFVKVMMDSTQFAYYSFAVSMEGFLNVAITPITTTLYNYFCNHSNAEDVIRLRRYVLLFGTIIVAAAFPAKFVIEVFLDSYADSVEVLFILFSSQILYVVIKGVYVNLYKAFKRQNTYFIKLIFVLVIGAILNYALIQVYPYKEAFAIGTLLSAFIWLILCVLDFKQYVFEIREWIYSIIEIVAFIACGRMFNSMVGLIIYIFITTIMMFIFMRNEIKDVFLKGRGLIKI